MEQDRSVVFHYKTSKMTGGSGVAEVTLAARFASEEDLQAVLKRFTQGLTLYPSEDLLQQVNSAMTEQVVNLEAILAVRDRELQELQERLAQVLSYQQAGIPLR